MSFFSHFSIDDLYQIACDDLSLSSSLLSPYQTLSNHDLFELILHKGWATEDQLLRACAHRHKTSYHDLSTLIIDTSYLATFSKALLFRHQFIPLFSDSLSSCIATHTPYSPHFLTPSFSSLFPNSVDCVYISPSSFSQFFSADTSSPTTLSLDYILTSAIHRHASDIHISRRPNHVQIHFRIDGELVFVNRIQGPDLELFLNQLTLHAHLHSTICHRPQDGYLTHSYLETTYHIRVSSLPTVYGHDFVCRIFQPTADFYTFSRLGFPDPVQDCLHQILSETSGLFLVTGATGSGKTSTLYACLSYLLAQQTRTIVTLEDPVETIVPGIRQSQISPDQGYTFASGLKAVLRQDPDCILIGEIRDRDTAKVAMDAAYIGHLVLSSLHTHDIRSSLHRLRSFDLDPTLVSHGLVGILSQHLVPKLCRVCYGDTRLYCTTCFGSGRHGRSVKGEIVYVSNRSVSSLLFEDPDTFLSHQDVHPF